MQILRKNSLIIFTVIFSVLLLANTAFFFYHKSVVDEYSALLQEKEKIEQEEGIWKKSGFENKNRANVVTVDEAVLRQKERELESTVGVVSGLQAILAISGVPLLLSIMLTLRRNRVKLTNLIHDIEESTRKYVFNSLEKADYNEDNVKSNLLSNLKKASDFIKAVAAGDYNIQWEGMNDTNREANQESIAGELIQMRDHMKQVKQQDEIRIWTTEGLSKFGEIIRKHQDDLDKLSENLILNVVKYIGAKVGGLFIVEEDERGEKYLQLKATYAYDRKKFIEKRIEIGEGLVGQSYIEGLTVHLTEVPDKYISITSGLGDTNPSSLLVVPLKANDKIEGVLEVASLKKFQPHEIEFVERLGELLASSIVTVRNGVKTLYLLQTSQEQSEEMRAQEEEMRQNMEELEATQEQMNRTLAEMAGLKESLEKEKYLLDSLMDNIPDSIYFKDTRSRFIRVSKYLASHLNTTVDQLIGKSDFDFQDKTHAQHAFDDEQNIMRTRQPKIDYVEQENATTWVSTTKMPLINAQGTVVGTFGISRDVSKTKLLEQDVINTEKSLREEKKRYEDRIRTLEEKLKTYEQRK